MSQPKTISAGKPTQYKSMAQLVRKFRQAKTIKRAAIKNKTV
jgi:hypothetical protein